MKHTGKTHLIFMFSKSTFTKLLFTQVTGSRPADTHTHIQTHTDVRRSHSRSRNGNDHVPGLTVPKITSAMACPPDWPG